MPAWRQLLIYTEIQIGDITLKYRLFWPQIIRFHTFIYRVCSLAFTAHLLTHLNEDRCELTIFLILYLEAIPSKCHLQIVSWTHLLHPGGDTP